MIRSALLGNKIDTGKKAMTSMEAYTGIEMSQQNFKKHLKMSNPKKNFLLSDRCTLLRLKIRFRIFYTKLDLFRMKIENINNSDCSYCVNLNDEPKRKACVIYCWNVKIFNRCGNTSGEKSSTSGELDTHF